MRNKIYLFVVMLIVPVAVFAQDVPPQQLPEIQSKRNQNPWLIGLAPPVPRGERGPEGEHGRHQSGFVPKKTSFGIDSSLSDDYQTTSIPLAFSFTQHFQVNGNLPVIRSDTTVGLGNSYLGAKLYQNVGSTIDVLYQAGVLLPTGEKDLGFSQAVDLSLGLSSLLTIEMTRLYFSYSNILRYPTPDSIGHYHSGNIGFDHIFGFWNENLGIYSAATVSYTTQDYRENEGLDNAALLTDIAVGFIINSIGVRLAVTVPAYTQSPMLDNSDRDISVDASWKMSL